MTKPAKRRVAIYARVSTQDQDPQMQLRELRAYAKSRAFTVAHEFIDHVSGATSVRPELSKLWQTARARKIDTVLVWKFDRFARPGFAVHRYMDVLLSFISNIYEKLLKGTSRNACIYVDCLKARQ